MTGVYHLIYWMVDQPCQLSSIPPQPLLISHLAFVGKKEERQLHQYHGPAKRHNPTVAIQGEIDFSIVKFLKQAFSVSEVELMSSYSNVLIST